MVAILSDTNAAQSLGPFTVIYIIIGGWAFIIVLFMLIYFIYYSQPPIDLESFEKRSEGMQLGGEADTDRINSTFPKWFPK